MVDLDIPVSDEKRVCYECVDEVYLSNDIAITGQNLRCSYCDSNVNSWSLSELADRVELAFEQHFRRTPDQPNSMEYAMLKDREFDYEWDREGEQTTYAIANAASVKDDIAQDIQIILEGRHCEFGSDYMGEEAEFQSDAHYEEAGPNDREWHQLWRLFERSLKTETRFFSRQCTDMLLSIFEGIESMQTTDDKPVVLHINPSDQYSKFFRARVFHSDNELEEALKRPDLSMSPPPFRLARAGRMNALGVSVFYGASSAEGALTEVRPSVGASAIVAQFLLLRPVKLLNLAALERVKVAGSIFDPTYAEACSRMSFVRTLTNKIARPILPGDEDFDYLPTQAVADFLANSGHFDLDGILFPSVQTAADSINVVLFHKSSKVQELDIPVGTQINSSSHWYTEEGLEINYSVTEKVPIGAQSLKSGQKLREHFLTLGWAITHQENFNERESTLKIDQDNLRVHQVTSVIINSSEYAVRRDRQIIDPKDISPF